MAYVVMIDPIGSNGLPTGQPILRNVSSEDEGLAVMKGAALDAVAASQSMVFTLYDHRKRLLISYTSQDGALAPLGSDRCIAPAERILPQRAGS